ncbi:MAG: flagellar motor switch protein FliG [Syntrophorhabdales bacterium]|jgi:flagellar motor switch protein FliG
METSSDIPGVRKAAILLLTMDEDLSKEVIKELEEDEIEAVGHEIAKLRLIPHDVVSRVHEEFARKIDGRKKNVVGGETKFKMLIEKSLGSEKAELFMGNMESRRGMPGDFLRTADPRILANVLRGEHPQTIALVLSILSVKKACDLVTYLPEKIHREVLTRMAYLEKVDKKVIEEVESVLKEQLDATGSMEGKQLGGVEVVASILNQMDRKLESELLGKIEEADAGLAERIRQLMFTFEDLMKIDDRGMQTLLKEITSEDVALSLKGASDGIRDKIFKNMSERASAMLKEDLDAMGPVRVSDVERSQIKIAMVAKRLESEGKIMLSKGNERFV